MKKISPWKLLVFFAALFSVFLLYAVLKKDYLALPNENISRGIEVGQYAVEKDFKDYYGKYYTATSDHQFLYLFISSSEGLIFKKFDAELHVVEDKTFADYKGLSELQVKKTGDLLQIGRYNAKTGTLEFLTLSDKDTSLKLEERTKLTDVDAYVLTPDKLIYGSNQQLYIKDDLGISNIGTASYLSTLSFSSDPATDDYYISYTDYVDGQYQLNTLRLNSKNQMRHAYNQNFLFGAGGATKPSELTTYIEGDELHVLSVIKDQKSGVNIAYWLKGKLHSLEKLEGAYFTSYTYSLSPQFYTQSDGVHLIFSSKTSIGKVEIGSDGRFQNLLSIGPDLKQPISLTKSTQPSLNPIWITCKDNTYLFYNQVNQGISKVSVASSKPSIIELSQHVSIMENLTLVMTALTTFMPLMYVSLIIEVYILTPVLIVVVFISMFKLTWAERNSKKLLLSSIAIHTITKFYFIAAHVLNSSDLMANLPTYLNSPFKFILWVLGMNALSLLALKLYQKDHPNKHYLHHYIFYNLVDLLLFTMLYAPYYLLQ